MKNVVSYLNRIIKNNKLSHLYLFYGENGSPIYETALDFAYMILSNLEQDLKIKRQVYNNIYPNLYVINKSEDESIIKDDIEMLQQEFSKTSALKGKRVYIINNFDKINVSAANSMLKFLEEPGSSDICGILLTNNIDKILKTIISRVQLLNIPTLDKNVFIKEISNEIEISQRDAEFLSILSKNINTAKTFFLNDNYKELFDIIYNMLNDFNTIEKEYSIDYYFNLKNILSNKILFKSFFEILLVFFIDCLKNKKSVVYLKSMYELSSVVSKKNFTVIREIVEMITDILKRINININLELNLFNFLIKLDGVRRQ